MYLIVVDMGSGYWKVVAEEETQGIMKFFNQYENQQRKVIPTRDLNTAPTFVEIMMNIQKE